MGRQKRDLSYLLPFCYYCDKTFDNEIILHQHQKAKHFTCEKCFKKFSTADLIKTHLHQAHMENLTKVSNALPDRSSVELKIFGMQGVPRNLIEERQKTKAKEYWEKIINEKNQKLKKEQKIIEKELKKKNRMQQQINNKLDQEQLKKEQKKAEENLEQPIPMNTISFGLTIKQKPVEKKEDVKPTNVFSFE